MVAPTEHGDEDRHDASGSVRSVADGHGQVVITVEGAVGALTVLVLRVHLDDAVAAGSRFVVIDASSVTRCGADFFALLGRSQGRLSRHRGLLTLRHMRPDLLPAAAVAAPTGPVPPMCDAVAPGDRPSDASPVRRRTR